MRSGFIATRLGGYDYTKPESRSLGPRRTAVIVLGNPKPYG